MTRVLVVSLNYRTADMTLRSVRAALAAMQGLDAELVVVDNASADGSDARIAQALAEEDWAQGAPVRLLCSPVNGGFGAGNNLGIRAQMSDGGAPDVVYLLNSDAFPEPDAIRALLRQLEAHPKAGIAGSRILGEDGETHMTAFRFPSLWSELEGAARSGPVSRLLAHRRVPLDVPQRVTPVDWLAGASMMLRRDMLEQVGLFDETFFLYFEETDLCRRAAAAGFEVLYVPESRVMHVGSVSTGKGRWARIPGYWLDSRWHYFSKAHGRGYAMAATLMHGLGGALWRVRRLVQGKPAADPPRFLRDLVLHDLKAMLRPLPTVRETQTRKVSDVPV